LPKNQLSLILPFYNPEAGWIEKILYYFEEIRENLSEAELFLIIVNDGTEQAILNEEIDKLRDKIKNFSYYSYKINKGKGFALRHGVARAVTSSVIYTDLDFPYTVDSICNIAKLLANNDMVIGIKNDNYYNSVPPWRRRISKWLQRMIASFFPSIITTDTQCGLKGFKGKAKDIFLETQTNDYLFDLEFVVKISREPDISFVLEKVQLRDNVKFSRVSLRTIFRELMNFLRIAFSRRRVSVKK
jgi:hypothetical protein